MWKRGEIAPLFHIFFQYVFTSGVTLIVHLLNVVVRLFVFLTSGWMIFRGTDISKYFRESLEIRDNESQLYFFSVTTTTTTTSRDKVLSGSTSFASKSNTALTPTMTPTMTPLVTVTNMITTSTPSSTHSSACRDQRMCSDPHVQQTACNDLYLAATYCPKLCHLCGMYVISLRIGIIVSRFHTVTLVWKHFYRV